FAAVLAAVFAIARRALARVAAEARFESRPVAPPLRTRSVRGCAVAFRPGVFFVAMFSGRSAPTIACPSAVESLGCLQHVRRFAFRRAGSGAGNALVARGRARLRAGAAAIAAANRARAHAAADRRGAGLFVLDLVARRRLCLRLRARARRQTERERGADA